MSAYVPQGGNPDLVDASKRDQVFYRRDQGLLGFSIGPSFTQVLTHPVTILANSGPHHLAVTKSGSLYSMYYDGLLVNTGASVTSATGDRRIVIGSDNVGSRFIGDIDEVEVFNRALSANEIQAIVDAGTFGKCKACGDATCDFIGGESTTTCGTQGGPANDCADACESESFISWYAAEGDATDKFDGFDGTFTSNTFDPVGIVGQAFRFDGVNEQVDIPAFNVKDFGVDSSFSVSAWINPDDLVKSTQRIVTRYGGGSVTNGEMIFDVVGNNEIRFLISGGPSTAQVVTAADVVSGGVWQHFVGTFDDANNIYYETLQKWC